MWSLLSLTLQLCVLMSCNNYCCKSSELDVEEAFEIFLIVPQIIPKAPNSLVIAVFGEWRYVMNLGNMIPPCATVTPPFTFWPDADPQKLYTLVGLDLDYPQFFASDPATQYVNGLTVNIRGTILTSGEPLHPYLASAPLPGSGSHRYVYLVYKQQRRIKVTTELLVSIISQPYNFSIAKFAKRFNLGDPIAGNFYLSRQSWCDLPMRNSTSDDGVSHQPSSELTGAKNDSSTLPSETVTNKTDVNKIVKEIKQRYLSIYV